MAEEQQYEAATNGNGEQQYTEQMQYEAPAFEAQPAVEGGGDASADAGPGDRINASKNDDDERKIFVGGLSWETTVKDLKEYFAKFGEVADCTLKTDPYTHRSRGFGFVLFCEPESVDKVVAEGAHTLHGKNIDPKRAKARGGREPIKKVFVGGLDPETPEADIRTHFEKFGKIEEIDLPFDKMKNQRRAFCFITFESEAQVDAVVAQPKQTLGTKEVDVKKATPKHDNQGGWGNQRGGYGGGGQWGDSRGRGRGGGQRGRGRGGESGGYDNQQSSWGDQSGYYGGGGYDYSQGYAGYGGGYDYSQSYGGYGAGGYGGGYDYSQGWGGYNQGYGTGYGQTGYGGGYDYSGWGGYNQQPQE